jgi:hypothetical protein
MSTDPIGTFSVTPECPACGPTNVRPADRDDDTIVFCDACGRELGTWHDVLGAAAMKVARPQIEKVAMDIVRKSFRGLK